MSINYEIVDIQWYTWSITMNPTDKLTFQESCQPENHLKYMWKTNPKNPDPSWSSRIDGRNIPSPE